MLPLSIWSWQDTVKAVLSGKAVVVDMYPGVYVRAVSIEVPVPSVIALREYAPTGKARPAFTRRNVFLRDGYRCQYCGGLFRTSDLSLDHVEPRCLGGRLTWENTATCCKRCNGRKGSLRPSELHRVGMVLRSKPRCPTLFELAAEAAKFVPRRVHPTWAPFLGGMSTKSAAVAVASSSSPPLSSSGGGYDDGANGGGGDGRKRMKKYRPYE
jgi:5-methylcytosine-specific restriction endonuclease McrA